VKSPDVATYTDLAPFFLAAFMSNEGMFHPSWFEQENFAALNEILPPEHALRVFDRMSEDPDYFRRAARDNRAQESNRRQYDFNPFAAKPFVNLPEGFGLAPQPAFVTGRFSPSTIFYAGSAHFAQDLESKRLFFTELGDINEDYVRLQLAQLQDVGARLDGPSEYAPGKESVDASIVMGSDLLLIEVKSTRPVFAARGNADDYRKHLDRDIKRGFEQLEISWRLYKDGMLGHLPPDLTVHGFVVTPEPFYLANWTSIHQSLPSPSMPVAILSFTELEELVSGALHDRALTGFVHAATNPANGAMDADPMAAIEGIKRRNNGVSPRNPLLDLSFDTDRWSQIHERDG